MNYVSASATCPNICKSCFGSLPQASFAASCRRPNEAIATLFALAKARDDQPALLNAMRGRAMILLFMGRSCRRP